MSCSTNKKLFTIPSDCKRLQPLNIGGFFIMEEIWKDIEGYEGIYRISNKGRVFALPKNRTGRGGSDRPYKGKTLKRSLSQFGYMRVALTRNRELRTFQVHRLVTMGFIHNPENKPEVNHINGIKDDNRVENLEWVTRSENHIHAHKNGLKIPKCGEDHCMAKLNEFQVRVIRKCPDFKNTELAKIFNVDTSHIGNIKKRKTWKHVK